MLLLKVTKKYGGYAIKAIVMSNVSMTELENNNKGVLIVQERGLLTMTFGSNRVWLNI